MNNANQNFISRNSSRSILLLCIAEVFDNSNNKHGIFAKA